MSFEDKINDFIGSLSATRASQMADRVREAVSDTGSQPADSEPARDDIPDMILAEDSGPVGDQMESSDYDYSIRSHSRAVRESAADSSPAGFQANTAAALFAAADQASAPKSGLPQNPVRSVMQKKLNHFQIERAAEIIKERLDSESKIEKERKGEEP